MPTSKHSSPTQTSSSVIVERITLKRQSTQRTPPSWRSSWRSYVKRWISSADTFSLVFSPWRGPFRFVCLVRYLNCYLYVIFVIHRNVVPQDYLVVNNINVYFQSQHANLQIMYIWANTSSPYFPWEFGSRTFTVIHRSPFKSREVRRVYLRCPSAAIWKWKPVRDMRG